MAVANNFPVAIQNQASFNLKNPERTLRSVLVSGYYLTFSTSGYNLLTFIVSSPSSNPRLILETSNDGIYWAQFQPVFLGSMPSNLSVNAGNSNFTCSNGVSSYQISNPGKFIRISQVFTFAAYTILNVILNNGSPAIKQQDSNIPTAFGFSYASASGGIVNTTPIGIATASISVSLTYLLLSLDLVNAALTDTEVLIRSNASIGGGSPTVIYRTFLKAGTSQSLRFKPGIKATAGQLMEIVLGSTATVYANAQGTQITS
jgi:hypothetical protein